MTSPPKVIWEEWVTTPHGRQWTCLLRVLLTAQCPLQTSPITLPQVHYIHAAVPHAFYMLSLHCQYPLQMNPITQPWVRYIYIAILRASCMLHCA